MANDRTLIWLKYRFIGDAVLSTPLIHAVADHFGAADVLAAPHLVELLRQEPKITLHEDTKLRGTKLFLNRLKWLRKQRYSCAVIVNRNFRTALLARLAGIPRRIGLDTEGRGILLTDRVPYDRTKHEAIAYARLGEPLGLTIEPLPPRLHVSPEERARGLDLLAGTRIGVQPGSTMHDRTFPADVLAKIINELGEPVALFGAGSEKAYADALAPLLDRAPVDLVGKCNLRESMGALANLDTFVAADSGLVHISAALGVRTVATFSLTPHFQWGHHYEPHRVLHAPEGAMARMDPAEVVAAIRGR